MKDWSRENDFGVLDAEKTALEFCILRSGMSFIELSLPADDDKSNYLFCSFAQS